MLISLYIKNIGLIDCIDIEFGSGLNVLTGETGAGKSIILEALQVSLGGRAQTDLIRTDQDRAHVQATFDISNLNTVCKKMDEKGIELDESEQGILILSRELNRQGRNICRINGRVVNLSTYKEIAELLVDMHGQHDQQSLLQTEKQMLLLDRFGGTDLLNLLKETASAYREWHYKRQRLEEFVSGNRDRHQRMDMLKYQIEEIDAAGLDGEDEEEMIRRRNILANAEKIVLLIESVINRIYKGNSHYSPAVDLLGESKNDLDELCRYIPECQNSQENLYSALCLVEETARELATYRENIEINPQELNYLEERLTFIGRLKKKYGESIVAILAYRNKIAAELSELQSLESDSEGLDNLVYKNEQKFYTLAKKLSKNRSNTAVKIEKAVEKELKDLQMNSVQFAVKISEDTPGPRGINNIQFFISPNPGEPLRPLAKTASGGELSRVMLALKSILASNDEVATLVFDEVDAGIGGHTLQAVAEKLEQLGMQRQIICVTHAAAIAAYASTHYLINKTIEGQKTSTIVQHLVYEDRIKELSRMLGGGSQTEPLLNHVRNILKQRLKK